jgi:transcriptional regulator with GAF, ATPase, and Fis domain
VRGELPPTVHRPTVVCLTDARAEALGPLLEALRRLRRYAVGRAPAVLLASTSDGVDAGDLTRVVVGALDRARTAELLQELYGLRPPPAVLDAWLDTTAGMPGRLVSLACALGPAGLQASRDALAARAATLHRPSAPEGLSPAALTLLAFLVALETPAATGALRALLGGDPHGPLAELVGAGAVTLGPERVTCHARLAPEAFPSALRARCADALERHAGALGGPEAVRLAQAALLRGDGPAAWAHAARACADPELSRSEAIRWLERTASGAPDPEAHALRLARARVLSGDASRALEDLAALPPSATVRALETDALRRAGRRDEARAVAARLLAEGDPSVRAVGALCLARDALDRGDLQGAQERLAGGLGDAEGVPPELQPRALEVGGLVALATGALDRCRARMERCDQRALALGDNVQRARARSVLGMLRLREGDAPGARRLFEDAFALASQEGDTLAGATYLLNLAGAELDTGDLGASLRGLERSVEGFAAVGRYGDLGRALANLSSLLELLGAAGEAREVAGRAVEAAGRHGDALTEAVAGCVLASLDPDRARGAEAMLQGARAVASAGDPARADEWRARTASRMVSLGDLSRAEEALPTGPGGALTALARAELLLHRGDSVALEEGLRAAQEAVGRDPSLEHQLLLGRLAERALGALGRHEEASRMRARARARVSTLAETLPARLAGAFLDAWQGHQEVPEARPAAGATEGSWRRLAGIAQRLNRETRLGPLLEIVMDAVIDLTGASRGFVLLRDEAHALRVRTARNMARQDLEGEDAHLSRSVAERVALSGEALLTVDATADGRLDAAESVHAMRLRSILAVPLTAQGEVQGCIYLDERYRAGAFGEGALEVARAFADAAGLALHNARTRHALRRALRRAERLSHQLERQVDAQRMELEVARQTLSAEGLRGRYDGILGRGPAMTKLLGLVDRVAPTAMSVLLQGESGTGKELVARALHGNSPRASRPFVAENCGAIPETLLESVLFGHVRGAFTGADRSRPGLFEVADGGTLFLDEVGETSPGMQARLLRVLQDGEVRPVGGERTRKVDVRVLAATHRNLAEMVRAGTFREDLYYRLAVVVLPVPALRERREDIPALVSHFLARHGGGVTLDRGALARLVGAPWPGNVRQLENELKRACVLADGVVREADLSPELVLAGASASGTTDAPRGPLDLRGAVEDTERELVTKALQEHHWNQSRAAAALGLSRFGLQKKLKRLGIPTRPR